MASLSLRPVGERATAGFRSRRYWAALWLASALLWGIGMGLPAATQAARDFRFSTNAPDKQFDYFQPSPRGKKLLNNVEQGHLVPGRRELAEGAFRHAHNDLDFVLRWYPNHPQALNLYSKLAMKRGQPESALPYFDYALRFSAKDLSTHILYGIHRFRMGDYRQAVERFQAALELNPEAAEAHYNLGLTYIELGEFDKARSHARRAYDLGHPLPGLRDKLKAQGQWRPQGRETASQ